MEIPSVANAQSVSVQVEKLAKMVSRGVSLAEIGDSASLELSQVKQIIDSAQFKEALAKEKDTQIANNIQQDDGWDFAENLALSKVIENLQTCPDPDYALKVAAIANKSTRRHGKHMNTPIVPVANMQAVINLNPTFVEKLQNKFAIAERTVETLERKTVNMLNPKSVKQMLMPKEETIEDAVDFAFSLNRAT